MSAVALPALPTLPAAARPPGAPGPSAGAPPGGFAKALQQAGGKPTAPAQEPAPDPDGPPVDDPVTTGAAGAADGAPSAPAAPAQDPTAPKSPAADAAPAWGLALAADAGARSAKPDAAPGATWGAAAGDGAEPSAPVADQPQPFAGAEAVSPGLPPGAEAAPAGPAPAAGAAPPTGLSEPAGARMPGLEAAAAPSAARPAATAAASAVAPATGQLTEPLHSPGFAPALGTQISVMLREGLSEARLQLNPAELGPIAVRISVEGPSARVDLVAAHAQTRQVLEQSMPVLASALRDQGLTLTGGGVFDQSRDPRQAGADNGGGSRPGPRPGPDGEGGGLAAVVGARDPLRGSDRPRGMLDLYA